MQKESRSCQRGQAEMAVTTYSSKPDSLLKEKGSAKDYLKQRIILNGIIRNPNLQVWLLFLLTAGGSRWKSVLGQFQGWNNRDGKIPKALKMKHENLVHQFFPRCLLYQRTKAQHNLLSLYSAPCFSIVPIWLRRTWWNRPQDLKLGLSWGFYLTVCSIISV